MNGLVRASLLLWWVVGCRYMPVSEDTGAVDSGGTTPYRTTITTPDETTVDDALVLGEVQACDAPAASVHYTEVGEAWGLAGAVDPDPDNQTSGGGVALFDVDLDGDLDFVLAFLNNDPVLYLDEGTLPLTAQPIPGVRGSGTSVNVGDLDGDGYPEVMFGKPSLILPNVNGTLDTENSVNLEWVDAASGVELSPGDLDGDGLPDLYALAQQPSTGTDGARYDTIYRNLGGLVFEEHADIIPEEPHDGKGFDVVWYDEDWDGDLDAYVSNDIGPQYGENVLWRNEGGALSSANEACACGIAMTGMGVDVADFDGNERMDLVLTHSDGADLYLQTEGGTYYDASDAVGLRAGEMGWGALFSDLDNSGDPDVLLSLGTIFVDGNVDGTPGDGLVAYLQQDGVLVDTSATLGIDSDTGSYRSVITADVNRDGVLDVLGTDVHARPSLYLSDGCTAEGWLEVEAPPGTRVVLEAGGRRWVDEVMHDSGRGASGPPVVHFGLGELQHFTRLRLILPGGEEVVAEGDLDARRVIRYDP